MVCAGGSHTSEGTGVSTKKEKAKEMAANMAVLVGHNKCFADCGDGICRFTGLQATAETVVIEIPVGNVILYVATSKVTGECECVPFAGSLPSSS